MSKGRSLFAGKEGQAVVAPSVTLVDDGLHPRGAASSSFDGEGMARRRTLLIERGWITSEDRADIERLLQRKLKKHGGNVRASLAEVLPEPTRQALAAIGKRS